jgi:hypothetical protein
MDEPDEADGATPTTADVDGLEDPFDDGLVADVAADAGLAPERLRDLLAAHQRAVRRYTTPEAWVYEVRRAARSDPLVDRRPEAFYLLVSSAVWAGFRGPLSASASDLEAIRAAHEAAFAARVGRVSDVRHPVVVVRATATGRRTDA